MCKAVLELCCEEMRRRTSPPSQVRIVFQPRRVGVFVGGGPRRLHANKTDTCSAARLPFHMLLSGRTQAFR